MKKLRFILAAALVSSSLLLVGCQSAAHHMKDVGSDDADRVTVGKVQREIKVGMSSAEVITSLGSPNIVSTDEKSREVWVYDKISTERAYSGSSGGLGGLAGDARGNFGLGAFGSYKESTGASSTSQRTLTIVIKFDENKKVRDLSYRTSSF